MANKNSGKSLTLAMGAVVVVVLALGAYAIAPKITENVKSNMIEKEAMELQTKLANGQATVSDYANISGMEVDEFLAYYGVTEEDGITEKSMGNEFREKITLAKYAEFFYGTELTEEEFAEFKTANSYGDDVTVETEDVAVKDAYDSYYQQKQAEAAAAAEAEAAAESADVTADTADTEQAVVEDTTAE